jgi:hypothetical protein
MVMLIFPLAANVGFFWSMLIYKYKKKNEIKKENLRQSSKT